MLQLVGEQGYAATTVPQVVAMARVSRNAFYDLFDDKLSCFLDLCEQQSEDLLTEAFQSVPGDWRAQVQAGAGRYLKWWAERPLFARAYLVETPTAGTRAIAERERAYARFAEQFALVAAAARKQRAGELAPLRPRAPWVAVAAITDMVAAEVQAGRTASLPGLEEEILWLVDRLLAEPASESR